MSIVTAALRVRLGVALLLLVGIVQPVSPLPLPAQEPVGLVTTVTLVDTANGQDIVLLSSVAPANFVAQRRDGCTYALSLPDLLPDPSVATQFFSSELIQNLSLRAAAGARAATEVCISVTQPVRSQVALRASGLTIRLVRTGTTEAPAESFRAVDALTPPSGPSPAVAAEVPPAGRSQISAVAVRERDLALREARVARRELELELAELRSQLASQVAANAVLDQQLSARDGFSDRLTPRIDRLMQALRVPSNGLERPVERFDAALAVLERQLADARSAGSESVALQESVDALLAEAEDVRHGLVMTNDDVNVRLEPSTSAVRVAFLPKGVLLHVVQEGSGWSLVSAGEFEGWIFSELLTPAPQSWQEETASLGSLGAGGRPAGVEQVRLRLSDLTRALELSAGGFERERLRANELDGRVSELTKALEAAQRAGSESAMLAEQRVDLQSEVELLRARLANAQASASVGDSPLTPDAAGLREQLRQLRARITGLLTLAQGSTNTTMVKIKEQTNLRTGPSVEQERLALLPIGIELALLDRNEGWFEVAYGSLHGWVFGEFAEILPGTLSGAPEGQTLDVDRLLERLERIIVSREGATGGVEAAATDAFE